MPVSPNPLARVVLLCHPQTPRAPLRSIEVEVLRDGGRGLLLRYALRGAIGELRLPSPQSPAPRDRLWAHTCCEAFVAKRDAPAYGEWNFSPSGQFAHYAFSDYRARGALGDAAVPRLSVRHDTQALELEARIEIPAALGDALQLGLSAVIEEAHGELSYWALRHAPGKPDFHHRAAFALALDLAQERTA